MPFVQGCTWLYVGLIRWLRLLPSLGLYMGCTAGNVIYVPLVLCSSSFGTLVFLGVWRTMSAREEERTQEKGRRRTGGGEEEGRRRPGGGQEEGPPPKSQNSSRGFGMFYSIVFHSILFDLNSATVYVFYSYLFCLLLF